MKKVITLCITLLLFSLIIPIAGSAADINSIYVYEDVNEYAGESTFHTYFTLEGEKEASTDPAGDRGTGLKFTTIKSEIQFSFITSDSLNDIFVGEKILFSINSLNIKANQKILIYNNETVVDELPGNTSSYTYLAQKGENLVYACVYDESNEILATSDERYTFEAFDFLEGKELYIHDYDDNNVSGWIDCDRATGSASEITVDDEHKKVQMISGNAYIQSNIAKMSQVQAEIISFECDRYYVNKIPTNYFEVLIGNSGSSWITMYKVSEAGIVNTHSNKIVSKPIEPNRWYHTKVVYDRKNSKVHLWLDGELLEKNISIPKLDNFQRFKMEAGNVTQYFDNFRCTLLMDSPLNADVSLFNNDIAVNDLQEVDYENLNCTINFSETPDINSLNENSVVMRAADGKVISCTGEYKDKKYTITPIEDLLPNMEYQIEVNNKVLSNAGIPLTKEYMISFHTIKEPFSLKSYSIEGFSSLAQTQPDSEITVNFELNNRKLQQNSAQVLVGIYKDNACYSINKIAVDTSIQTKYSISLKTPSDVGLGGYYINVFLVDNNLLFIDCVD